MQLEDIVVNLQLTFLIFARIVGMLRVAPIFSSTAIHPAARGGLALAVSVLLLPGVIDLGYYIPDSGLMYALFIAAELLVGVIIGMIIQLVYTIFQLAGQFFSFQMGMGASQAFDPLSQVTMPLMGQYFNLLAMYVFIIFGGLNKIFITGIYNSFRALKATDILQYPEYLTEMFAGAIGRLFQQGIIIALPMMTTLLLLSLTLGLLAKAAPQMNLLMVGFPIQISLGFIMIFMASPFILEHMVVYFEGAFRMITDLYEWYFSGGGMR